MTAFAGREASELSTEQRARIERNCPLGLPVLEPSTDHAVTTLITRGGYVLEHSARDKLPLFVCERVERAQLQGNEPRKDRFKPDPLLAPGLRAELEDYRGSGFDRGHLAPAGNQTLDAQLKVETFYLSNMAPQLPGHNRKVWKALEDQTREWIEARGDGYVISGPLFHDPAEEDATTADGLIEYLTIGPGGVAVPTHFYKLVVAKDEAGQWQALAFVLENRPYPKPWDLQSWVHSVDWIEARTGLDFLPELPTEEAQRLEATPNPLWE